MSYNSTQLWHYLPGDCIRFHRFRVSPTRLSLTFRCHSRSLCFWQTSYRMDVPAPSSQATQHRCQLQAQAVTCISDQLVMIRVPKAPSADSSETFCLLDHWFTVKGHRNSQMEEMNRTRYTERGQSSYGLSRYHCPQSPCSPIQKFSKPHTFGVFLCNFVHQHDWLNH